MVRFSRSMIGCRYDTDDEARVPSFFELIWKNPAPLTTVEPLLNCTLGMPCCSQASSSATPTGSFCGTFINSTGPSAPLCSPELSLVSLRLTHGSMVSAFQPSAPISSHRSMSSAGGWNAMQELCEEQPPSTLARAWRINEFPFSCSSIG